MPWLLDTNVLSELRRLHPNPAVQTFVQGCRFRDLHVSCVTLAELRYGIRVAIDSLRQEELMLWLERTVRPMFQDRVLDLNEDTLLHWRVLHEMTSQAGRTRSAPDLLIAAVALERNLTLVTRNVKDFAGLGLTLYNPWDNTQ